MAYLCKVIFIQDEIMNHVLFFDIDGTLVSFETHKVPQSAVEGLQKAHDRGNKIIISTGRPYCIINNLTELQDRNLIDGYITMNGSYCFAGDKVLYKSPIPAEDVATLCRICAEHGYPCIVVTEKELKVVNPDSQVHMIFNEFLNVDEIDETTFEEAQKSEVYQMTPFFDAEAETAIAPLMPGCEFNRWYPAFVDVTAKGNTKARGVMTMLDSLGLPLSASIAFGDGGNDVPMLKEAAVGVAMGNSAPDVQKEADMVTDSVDNDGILNALKRLDIID